MKYMEIKINKLGTNSVLGVFAEHYIQNMSDVSFDAFMKVYRGCTVSAVFKPSFNEELDDEVIQSNMDFCNKHGLVFKIVE